MKTLTIELGTINESTNGVDWTLDLSKIPEPEASIMALIRQGVLIIAQRVKSGEPLKDRLEALPKVIAEIEAGTYSFGTGGGGGPRMTIEEAGRVAYYNSKGGIKIKGQTCNGKNLADYDRIFVKNAIWDDLRDLQAALPDEASRRKFLTDDVPGYVQDNMENVLAIAQKDTRPGFMGDYIESERRKRNPVAETFKVKMVIKPKA
jgi:hypothetical protein